MYHSCNFRVKFSSVHKVTLANVSIHPTRILLHRIGEHPSEPNSFGGFEPATTLPRWTGQVASALHESMWQYHKYRSLYVRPGELRPMQWAQEEEEESGYRGALLLHLSALFPFLPRVSISNRSLYCGLAIAAFYERASRPAGRWAEVASSRRGKVEDVRWIAGCHKHAGNWFSWFTRGWLK